MSCLEWKQDWCTCLTSRYMVLTQGILLPPPSRLISLILFDHFHSGVIRALKDKLQLYIFSCPGSWHLGYLEARAIIKQRIQDIMIQVDRSQASSVPAFNYSDRNFTPQIYHPLHIRIPQIS